MTRLIPAWTRKYRADQLPGDLLAALVVTIMLVPQGLAYASLAGLPPQLGLYASLLPLVAYALFGSSMVMSVGPVAVTSLMTASALSSLAAPGSPEYIAAAVLLAFLSGLILFVFGLLKLGQLTRLLSHPVISGFIAGSAVLIIIGQLRPLLGIQAEGETAITIAVNLLRSLDQVNLLTASIGLGALLILWLAKKYLAALLARLGLPRRHAELLSKLAPMAAVLGAVAVVAGLDLEDRVQVVGSLPAGLPSLVLPSVNPGLLGALWLPALIIGLVGYIESISIAQAYARRNNQPVNADAELRGLGAANMASALSGGFPVAGGFSRTVVNAEAGAQTPLAGIFSAVLIAGILVFSTGLFQALPIAVLAATIMVAATGLLDIKAFTHIWRFDHAEGLAFGGTALGVVLFGVENGVLVGIALSLATLVWRASHPHIAVLGRVPDTEHFRNVERFEVETRPGLLIVRVDEILFFGNAEAVEERLESELDRHPDVRHLVLDMASVSHVDATASEMLEQFNSSLHRRGILLHFAEVKGPVLERLKRGHLLDQLYGQTFLSTYSAFKHLRR